MLKRKKSSKSHKNNKLNNGNCKKDNKCCFKVAFFPISILEIKWEFKIKFFLLFKISVKFDGKTVNFK